MNASKGQTSKSEFGFLSSRYVLKHQLYFLST